MRGHRQIDEYDLHALERAMNLPEGELVRLYEQDRESERVAREEAAQEAQNVHSQAHS
jgi:hypothetical protein